MTKRLLVIDALNTFIRAYVANPALSVNGEHVGGVLGVLKILQKTLREVKPDKVFLVWDGEGGSSKRKSIDKNYKSGRNPLRLNRAHDFLNQDEELQSMIRQQIRVSEYIEQMPIEQILVDNVEADDIISLVCQRHFCDEWQKVILSNDKDFFQLLDGCTILIRSTKNEIKTQQNIVAEFGIHPNNFALARAIAGDRSDNLKGVNGIGLKTLAKKFPFLAEEDYCSIERLVTFCKKEYADKMTLSRIPKNVDIIKRNYDIMQLYSPSISFQTTHLLKEQLKTKQSKNNQTAIRRMLVEDGIYGVNFDELFMGLNRLERGET